jgi:adenylate cyclase
LGDGLFVFWNAPSYHPDHAILACEAALQQQEALVKMRSEWKTRGLPEMFVRIGINTGHCLVGNFGSRNHLKYTVMGDAVNIASRLEGLNKTFRTSIILGHETFRQCQEHVLARPLSLVVLKGKTAPTMVYELMCRKGEATDDQLLLAKSSSRMFTAFLARDFKQAVEVCEEILALFPGDASAILLRERCYNLMSVELPADWTGAWVAPEK